MFTKNKIKHRIYDCYKWELNVKCSLPCLIFCVCVCAYSSQQSLFLYLSTETLESFVICLQIATVVISAGHKIGQRPICRPNKTQHYPPDV